MSALAEVITPKERVIPSLLALFNCPNSRDTTNEACLLLMHLTIAVWESLVA